MQQGRGCSGAGVAEACWAIIDARACSLASVQLHWRPQSSSHGQQTQRNPSCHHLYTRILIPWSSRERYTGSMEESRSRLRGGARQETRVA